MDKNKLRKHIENPIGNTDVFHSIPDPSLVLIGRLIDDLDTSKVGNYKIIIHPNIPMRGSDNRASTLELDLIVVNRFGVFGIDILPWQGKIIAYDSVWIQEINGKQYERNNPLISVESKCKVLGSYLDKTIGVVPLIVVSEGNTKFINQSHIDPDRVVGEDSLISSISNPSKLFKFRHRELIDDEIAQISSFILRPSGSLKLAGDSTTDAPPPDVSKKKKKRKGN